MTLPLALLERLAVLPDGWEKTRVGRVTATEDDPLLFAYLYLRRHITDAETGEVSFSQVHLDWAEQAKRWLAKDPTRDIYIAPRSLGKSTWFYLLLPMWAASHRVIKFVAAFSDAASQAETHLATFRHEVETNALLRQDFPDLCKPATRSRGVAVADNRSMLQTKSGFTFAARGIDAGTLGTKVGELRPDLLLLDDVEPGAANYSTFQAEKRLQTITDVILPLNDRAKVAMVGTTVMQGSIVHQAVQHAAQPAQWITDERFQVHHALPFDDAGESIWPERWSTEHLRSIQGHRSFALNFMNMPVASDGAYWSADDISIDSMPFYPRTIISIDPAVTKKRTSDFTGIAVLSRSPDRKRVFVRKVWKVKLSPKDLEHKIGAILLEFPEVSDLVVETNQGGDTWKDRFSDLVADSDIRYYEVKQSIKKEDRALVLLNEYQKRNVCHAEPMPDLESELLAFPNGLNDDLVDAVGTGVTYLTGAGISSSKQNGKKTQLRSLSYI